MRELIALQSSRWVLPSALAGLLATAAATRPVHAQDSPAHEDDLKQRIGELVEQLSDDDSARRDEAEAALVELAPAGDATAGDALLAELPEPNQRTSAELHLRLMRIRKKTESRLATGTAEATRITLHADKMTLPEVFAAIEEQTGNRLVDFRDQFGQEATSQTVTVDIDDQPFWQALDRILDDAGMDVYSSSGEGTLGVVSRGAQLPPRTGRAAYAGPFRLDVNNVLARRPLRSTEQSGVQFEVEISWEPRLQPIALALQAAQLTVTADDGSTIATADPEASLDVEAQPGSHSTELNVTLELPPRSVSEIASMRGQLMALVPGRVAEFRFTGLDAPKTVEQQRGGVTVTLEGIRQRGGLAEVYMRIRLNNEETGLESYRGWVFHNLTYMENAAGEKIDHAGFETMVQNDRELGLAYFFEVPDDLTDYTWVYRTPAAIQQVPIEFELKNIPLP